MQAEHHGRMWQMNNDGAISWWDGNQWVWWNPNVPGPQPPPHFFAPAQPVYYQKQKSSFGRGFGGALGCMAAFAFLAFVVIVILVAMFSG